MTERSLEKVCERALEDVQARGDHHLRLGMRQAVWAELGPRASGKQRLSEAHRRRIALAVASAQRVRSIWDRRYSGSRLWNEVLTSIGAVVRGEIDMTAALRRFDEYWAELTHIATAQPSPAVAAGFALVGALDTTIADEQFNPAAINPLREDGDDAMELDAAAYAEAAEAGGMPWDDAASADRRMAFWKWWLNEALHPTVDDAALRKL